MFRLLEFLFGTFVRVFQSRGSLLLENLALRQQLTVLKRRHPKPRLDTFDRVSWVFARRIWSRWKQALITDLDLRCIGVPSPERAK